jgi:D-alanyl-D-alanine dipeptidase
MTKLNATFKNISHSDLIAMDDFAAQGLLKIDLAYAKAGNLLFGEAIYRPDARLWLHKDLANIVVLAAQKCRIAHGFIFVLHDGLRTVEAQEKMLKTQRVRNNPQWLVEPRLLSPPGQGGHPRAMAIDISLEDSAGKTVDMGTAFDFLAADPSPANNPAHREYVDLKPEIAASRAILTNAMLEAAADLNLALLPLPQEWWDFRFPADIYNAFAPLRDADLPPEMRMVG